MKQPREVELWACNGVASIGAAYSTWNDWHKNHVDDETSSSLRFYRHFMDRGHNWNSWAWKEDASA